MMRILAVVLAQPAPPPVPVVWSSDGGSVSARVGTNTVATVSGTGTGTQTKTCSANNFLSTLAAGTSSVCTQPTFSGVSGSASLAQNGTGAGAPAADDQLLLSSSTSATAWASVPDCDGPTKALNYRTASNVFACNTFSSSGGYDTVQNEGSSLAQRSTVNFVGAVTCVDNSGASRTDCTVSSGSGNAVEVAVTMPSDGSGWAQTVVTGQTWVGASSKILCQPFNDGGDSNNTDEVYSLAAFATTVSTRVVGTGFTLTAMSLFGVTGTFKFHCVGV